MNILMSLLSNSGYIIVNKEIIRKIGLHEAIILGELCSEYVIAPNDTKPNSYVVMNNNLYYRELSTMRLVNKKSLTQERIRGMIKIRDVLDKLIEIQGKSVADDDIKPLQERLNKEYDNFVKKYGIINNSANKSAFEEDCEYPLLSALENINEETKEATKTDIFYK